MISRERNSKFHTGGGPCSTVVIRDCKSQVYTKSRVDSGLCVIWISQRCSKFEVSAIFQWLSKISHYPIQSNIIAQK